MVKVSEKGGYKNVTTLHPPPAPPPGARAIRKAEAVATRKYVGGRATCSNCGAKYRSRTEPEHMDGYWEHWVVWEAVDESEYRAELYGEP